jgi:predicted dehydrogenase
MANYLEQPVILVGTGNMALQYAKVLKALTIPFIVIGRSESSAANFFKETGVQPMLGLQKVLSAGSLKGSHCIIAVSVVELKPVAAMILEAGFKNILLEKPGGIDLLEVRHLSQLGNKLSAQIFIAFNRRFFSSVLKADELIKENGGIKTCFFDFTETGSQISESTHPGIVKKNWLMANSSHVIDLAFYFSGPCLSIHPTTRNEINWAPASIFSGSGVTKNRCQFVYHANWSAGGRWNIQLTTGDLRLSLCPMETLQVMKSGSFESSTVAIDDDLDKKFKPGLFRQTKAFLESSQTERFVDINSYQSFVENVLIPIQGGTVL